MIDELISESLSSSSSLSLLHNTREIGSAPWDDTLLDAFDEIFGDFF